MPKVSVQKQYELIYQDLNQVTTATKAALFELSRWIVTLNVLIVGAVFVEQVSLPPLVMAGPVLVGAVGCLMHSGFHAELREHRRTLALVRSNIGNPMSEIYADHIKYHLERIPPTHRNYWMILATSYLAVIILSSFVSLVLIYMKYST